MLGAIRQSVPARWLTALKILSDKPSFPIALLSAMPVRLCCCNRRAASSFASGWFFTA